MLLHLVDVSNFSEVGKGTSYIYNFFLSVLTIFSVEKKMGRKEKREKGNF